MDCRTKLQLDEALGPVNRWFCSIYHGKEITEEEVLLIYYIQHDGAADFGARWAEAMSQDNRWYCSEFYHRDTREPRVLWEYYMAHALDRACGNRSRNPANNARETATISC